jgi:hypothetical protein
VEKLGHALQRLVDRPHMALQVYLHIRHWSTFQPSSIEDDPLGRPDFWLKTVSYTLR